MLWNVLWKSHLQNVQTLFCDTVPHYISLEERHGLFPQLLAIDLKTIHDFSTLNITINSELQIFQATLCSDSYAAPVSQNMIWSQVSIIFLNYYISKFKKSLSKLRGKKNPKNQTFSSFAKIWNFKLQSEYIQFSMNILLPLQRAIAAKSF